MTGPAADAQYIVQAVQENAERLGLIWKRKRAIVISTGDSIMATLDGDTEPIAVTSMIGPVAVGQRVYVDVIPPSGNFISGTISASGDLGCLVQNTVSGSLATASPNFVDMNVATPTFTKLADSTRLVVTIHTSGYMTGFSAMADTGFLINGGDYVVGSLVYNVLLSHQPITGVVEVPAGAVPAGEYTVRARVRVTAPGTFNMDSGDRVSFEVTERS